MKAASTVLTGGLGRRTERQRALILPTGTPTLTYLACDVSERAETSIIDGRSRVTHSTWCTCYGDGAGQPGFTLQTISGAAESGWGIEQHATYIISFESYGVNTGDLRKDAKAGGSRKARAV